MKRNCLHCGHPLTAKRNTKKYCSDRCKQAAFYTRAAQVNMVGGNDKKESMLPFNVKVIPLDSITNHDEQGGPSNTLKAGSYSNQKPFFRTSALIDEIGESACADVTIMTMMQSPMEYWHGSDLEKVKWVSARFRSVLENLLRLDRTMVEYKSLALLRDAMTSLINATKFQFLPFNYPFKIQIRQWQKILSKITKDKHGVVRFKLVFEHKIQLMITRFLLADLVPFVRFATLDFAK